MMGGAFDIFDIYVRYMCNLLKVDRDVCRRSIERTVQSYPINKRPNHIYTRGTSAPKKAHPYPYSHPCYLSIYRCYGGRFDGAYGSTVNDHSTTNTQATTKHIKFTSSSSPPPPPLPPPALISFTAQSLICSYSCWAAL